MPQRSSDEDEVYDELTLSLLPGYPQRITEVRVFLIDLPALRTHLAVT